MKIDNGSTQTITNAKMAYAKQMPTDKKATESTAAVANATSDPKQDAYIPSDPTVKKATYEKPVKKPDMETISKLKEDSERVYGRMRDMVKQLLQQQGLEYQESADITKKDFENLKVDEATQAEAAASIAAGGEWSAESVSDKILEFAQNLAGDDKSKIDELRSAIEKGFEAAKEAWGGDLPEISQQTYKLVQEKLDRWEKGESSPAAIAV